MRNAILQYLAVGLFGALGAMARYLVGTTCGRWFGASFPIGTLVINLSGSFFLGWLLTFTRERVMISDTTRLALAVGFTGAYTTFSTFMYETDSLLAGGAFLKAAANLLLSLVLGLLAVRLGMALALRM